MTLPKVLFHGSATLTTTLKPTGEKDKQPAVIYAVEDKDHAIEMAFSAILNDRYPMDRFQMTSDEVVIDLNVLSHPLTKAMLQKMRLYVYTISPKHSDAWQRVQSRYCSTVSEWQTNKVILPTKCDTLNVSDWLKNKQITITHPRFK